ncbi:MAG TPA: M56 family metallopeptidase [Anaeromyxobacteraceae bacterium]|nr:M56 family metallopeptidase [Anaeromyxobacteraceae bacterium]
MPGRWADFVAQSIVHALVGALAVEALLRLWRIGRPEERLALRSVALLQPLVVSPLLALWPWRAGEAFHERWALFSGRHWEEVRILGVSLYPLFVLLLVALGLVLFLLDLVPLVRGSRRVRGPEAPAPSDLAGEVAALARAAGTAPPPLRVLELDFPALYCSGVRLPAVVVSRGALRLLDPTERRAALAHEMVHLAQRDPLVSWLLMAVRALLLFNPVAQVLARTMAREAERRADDRGAEIAGDRLALASALVRLYRASGGAGRLPTLPFGTALREPLRRARFRDVELRCRRLLDDGAPGRSPLARLRLSLVALALPALLLLVA